MTYYLRLALWVALTYLGLVVAAILLSWGWAAHAAPRLQYSPGGAWGARQALPVSVRYAPTAALPALCRLSPERLVGCAYVAPDRCLIIVGSDLSHDLQLEVLHHEMAHCEGWHHGE